MKTGTSNKRGMFDKRLQRWAVPLLAVLAIFAIMIILRFMNRETTTQINEDVYQFSLDRRLDYSAGTTMLQGKYAIILRSETEETDGDPTPLYSSSNPAMYLMRDASWVEPYTGDEWAVDALCKLEWDGDDNCRIVSDKASILLEGGILNDCAGTYVFIDPVDLLIDGKQYALSPFSFCSINGKNVRVYCYDDKDYYTTQALSTHVIAQSGKGYSVDLSTGIYTDPNGEYRLLVASPDLLRNIKDR
ncbi:MAG: hypothetical protein IJQ98_00320 [Oscillospiraceae bacterium]|nr:hypothetical protein [Oscillospiraceae bacterium]